jgi:NAD(P)-dependent dehydrogenase (short-subunit alcohol dehydrogenase family)
VILTDHDESGLAETIDELEPFGERPPSIVGDITDRSTSKRVVSEALTVYGSVSGLCNAAGISPAIALESVTETDIDDIFAVNLKAQVFMIQAVVPALRRSGGGSIVNVSSVGGRVALPHLAVYGASKAAVLGLTRGVAAEFARDNIRCNAVCPGGINTPMADRVLNSFPDRDTAIAQLTGRQLLKRFADPSEIANLIAYLVSDESSFVTGATLDIDAGHTAI